MKKKKILSGILSLMLILSAVGLATSPVNAVDDTWQSVGNTSFSLGMVSDISLYVYNATPYVAYQDRLSSNKVTVKKYTNNSWTTVGTSGLSAGQAEFISLYVYDGIPYVAYKDATEGLKLTVKKFNGSSWVSVGSEGFSAGKSEYTSLYVYNGIPYVAYKDSVNGQKLSVKKYDGSSWVTVGSEGFSPSKASYISLYIYDGTPYVAFQDLVNSQKASVMKYDGTKWVNVGNAGFSAAQADYLSLQVYNGTPYVAYKDYGNQHKTTVMKYNGTAWTPVGKAGFSTGTVGNSPTDGSADASQNFSFSMDNGTPYVAFVDTSKAQKSTVMKYNGSTWAVLGNAGFSSSKIEHLALSVDNGTPYLAYKDSISGGKGLLMSYISASNEASQPEAPAETPAEPVNETPAEPTNETIGGFTDISNHWAVDAIVDMNSKGIINGVGNGLFEPSRNITRAEFASIIVRALGLSKGTTGNLFSDIYPSDWYSDNIITAYENNLITGYNDGTFQPQLSITREQAIAIIVRSMKIKGLDTNLTPAEEANILSAFSDRSQISDWAESSVAPCVKFGIVTGRSGKVIAPQDNITRAETAVIIQRLLSK